MTSDERILQLAEQLIRVENPGVRETVAALLHLAIDEYMDGKRRSLGTYAESSLVLAPA